MNACTSYGEGPEASPAVGTVPKWGVELRQAFVWQEVWIPVYYQLPAAESVGQTVAAKEHDVDASDASSTGRYVACSCGTWIYEDRIPMRPHCQKCGRKWKSQEGAATPSDAGHVSEPEPHSQMESESEAGCRSRRRSYSSSSRSSAASSMVDELSDTLAPTLTPPDAVMTRAAAQARGESSATARNRSIIARHGWTQFRAQLRQLAAK